MDSKIDSNRLKNFIANKYDITIIEKNDYLGGHAHTHTIVDSDHNEVILDTGFLVFNHHTYPKFIKFLQENQLEFEETNMSFSFQNT